MQCLLTTLCVWLSKLPCLQIQAQLQLRGYTVVRQYPSFNRLIVSGGNLAATASTDGSFNSSDLAKQVSIELKGLGGVEGGELHTAWRQMSVTIASILCPCWLLDAPTRYPRSAVSTARRCPTAELP